MTAAKKKAAPKAEPKAAPKPRLAKPKTVAVPVPDVGGGSGFAHVTVALPANVSDSMRGWRVKHHMTKYHDRPDAENPFVHLSATGACVFCGGKL